MSYLVHRSWTESNPKKLQVLEVLDNYHLYSTTSTSTSTSTSCEYTRETLSSLYNGYNEGFNNGCHLAYFDYFGLSHHEDRVKAHAVKWLGVYVCKLIKLLRINRKDHWQQIKWNANHPSHCFLAEMAWLNHWLNHSLTLTTSSASTSSASYKDQYQDKDQYTNTNTNGNTPIQNQRHPNTNPHAHQIDSDQLLIRFSYDDSCINPQQEIVFVFSLKPNNDKALQLLIRTIAYMFCNENRKTGQGAQTVQECYQWATNPMNQIRHLDFLPIHLRYAIVKSNPIIEIYNETNETHETNETNETMNSMFQEGIIHRDYYSWQSHGIVDFDRLKLSAISTSTTILDGGENKRT